MWFDKYKSDWLHNGKGEWLLSADTFLFSHYFQSVCVFGWLSQSFIRDCASYVMRTFIVRYLLSYRDRLYSKVGHVPIRLWLFPMYSWGTTWKWISYSEHLTHNCYTVLCEEKKLWFTTVIRHVGKSVCELCLDYVAIYTSSIQRKSISKEILLTQHSWSRFQFLTLQWSLELKA